jgi:asparagine synthase (glutamine-hydrolysing)
MCGINLIVSKKPIPQNALTAMQQSSHYRGPDNSGNFFYEKDDWFLAIGANRLMVIDRDPSSNQPVLSDCGNFVLAYNGEVYNYQDLKNRLINKGVTFKTHSDTEVVLYWLKEFGVEGVAQLKGMYAFVFVDLKNSRILASRDRQGIKPLYYFSNNNTFVCSSSIRAIEDSKVTKLTINDSAISEYLDFRHVLGQKTFLKEVSACEPGVVLEINQELDYRRQSHSKEKNTSQEDLRNSMIESITLQYNLSDAPGLMLSGGVDSTLILAMLNRELSVVGAPTYTLNTGQDAEWAIKAAKLYQAEHQPIDLPLESPTLVQDFLTLTDQPIADHGAFATWLLAREVKKNHRVLISGAGADELFGGYNRHRAYYYYLNHPNLLQRTKTLVNFLRLDKLLPNNYKKLFNAVSDNLSLTFENFLKIYPLINSVHKIQLRSSYENPDKCFVDALKFDQANYLVNDVLAISDNAGMQQGVEIRAPFLYDSVEGAAKRFTSAELMAKKGKGPLKDLLSSYGGGAFVRRSKMGFGLPMGELMRGKAWRELWEFLERDNPIYAYVPKMTIENLWSSHLEQKADNNMQLWSILVLENWLASR